MKKLVSFLIIILGAVAVQAQKVKVTADPSVDLSKYKTYAWADGAAAPNPIINKLIGDSIDQALAAKGMTKVSEGADITVAVWGTQNSELHVSYPTYGRSASGAPATGLPMRPQGAAISKGTLVVDISDARTKSTVWRATSTQTLAQNPSGDMARDAKGVEKPIRKAVEKMFKRFPLAK